MGLPTAFVCRYIWDNLVLEMTDVPLLRPSSQMEWCVEYITHADINIIEQCVLPDDRLIETKHAAKPIRMGQQSPRIYG